MKKLITLLICQSLLYINAHTQNNTANIVGGNEIYPPFSHSYVGSLFRNDAPYLLCGAVLISPRAALTAAHCIRSPGPYNIYFHRHNQTVHPMHEGAILRRISRTIIHPNYSGFDYDYGLLLWESDILLPNPVRILFGKEDHAGLCSTALGWGATSEGGPQSDVLLGVAGLPIWENTECANVMNTPITDRMICAGGQSGRDSCQGDSGSPMFLDMTTKLIGLVSWGRGCARPGLPGIYARVSEAETFIRMYVDLPY